MIATTLGLCLSVLPATAPQLPSLRNSDQDRVLLTYPLRELTGIPQVPYAPPLWSVLGGPIDEIFGETHLLRIEQGGAPFFSGAALLDLLSDAYGEDLDERVFLEILNQSTLVVRGDPVVAGAVVETLGRMQSLLARPIRITAQLYDWDGQQPPPAVVSSEELAELTRGLQPLWAGQSVTRSSAPVGLGQELRTLYVRSARVEVAVNANIGGPVMAEMFEGIRIVVEPHALIGSDAMVVMCQFAISQPKRPMALRHTGIPGLPTLDVPYVDMDTGAMSGRIPDGGAILYCAQSRGSEGSSVLLVVSAEYQRNRGVPPEGMRLVPVSAMVSGALTSRPSNPSSQGRRYIETFEGWLRGRTRGYGGLDPDGLRSLVMDVHPDSWGDSAFLDYTGGYFFLRGDQVVLEDTERLLLQLQDRWLKTAHVEVLTTLEGAKSGLGPLREAIPTGADVAEPLHRIVFPALLGRSHVSLHGVETTYIDRVGVEVAEDTKAPYPVVNNLFRGMYSFVLPYAIMEGLGVGTRMDLVHAKEPERRATNLEGGADIYPASIGIAHFAHHGPIEPGQYLEFGIGPTIVIDNQTYRTRQQMRIVLR